MALYISDKNMREKLMGMKGPASFEFEIGQCETAI